MEQKEAILHLVDVDVITKGIELVYKTEEEIFLWALKNMAEPPITGKITERKLKLRKIEKVSVPSKNQSWLAQNGKRISPIVEYTTPFCKWL